MLMLRNTHVAGVAVRFSVRLGAAIACLVVLTGAAAARAQPEESSSEPIPTPAKGTLGRQYVDGSFGFALKPPAGLDVLLEKRFVSGEDVELVRFVSRVWRWSLSARQSKTTRPLDADAIVKGITEELSAQCTDVKVIRGDEARIASREAVRYAATLVAKGVPLLRQQAVIRTKPTEYFVLVFVTPAGDGEVATPLFDKIEDSCEILRSEKQQEQIREALERGAALLRSVAAGDVDLSQAARGETFLRCIISGKETGFIQIREEATTLGHRKGIAVRKWGWLFKSDGKSPGDSVTHMRHDMFLANDLSHEEWENRLMILAPAQSRAGYEVVLDVETAVRQDDQLLLRYTAKPNAPELMEKVIEIERSYASAPWDLLLPRLVDLSKPELYVFSSYDSSRRGLVMRALRVVGSSRVRIEGRTLPAVKIEDSEGLIPPIHEVYVDEKGRILRVLLHIEGSPMEMVATTQEYVERTYGARLKKVQALFQQHPAREPGPARRTTP